MFGLTAYVLVLKYLNAVVVSVVFLLNPILGTLWGVLLKVNATPKPLEITGRRENELLCTAAHLETGGCIMLFGTLLVSYAMRPRKQSDAAALLSDARCENTKSYGAADVEYAELRTLGISPIDSPRFNLNGDEGAEVNWNKRNDLAAQHGWYNSLT